MDAASSGPVAGLLLGLGAALSGGPLGAHRLAEVGPSGWRVGLAFGLEVAAGGCVAVALLGRGGRAKVARGVAPGAA